MAKKAAKRKGRKATRRTAAAPSANVTKTVNEPVENWIKKLRDEQAKAEAEMERQRQEKLTKAIEQKKAELEKAIAGRDAAQTKVDNLSSDLAQLESEMTGAAPRRRGRPAGKKAAKKAGRKAAKKAGRKKGSGRKPRVSTERKQEELAKELKKHSKGIAFSDLRDIMVKKTASDIGGPIFAPTDFASSRVFGKKLLPKGWKIKGTRKNAEVVKS